MSENLSYNQERNEAVNERASERLARYLKHADIEIKKGTEQINATVTAKDEAQYVAIKLLLEIAGIDPWDNEDALKLSFGKHDIAILVELGVMELDNFLPDEQSVLNNGVDDDTTQIISQNYNLPELRLIPEIFTKDKDISPFDDMSEPVDGEEEHFSYGNTSYLYNAYKRKYRREVGGIVFKKEKVNGKVIETELTKDEQDEILSKAQAGDEVSRNEYLIMNIGLVYLVALNLVRKFPKTNLAELLQEGMIIMNQCIDLYRPGVSIDDLVEIDDDDLNTNTQKIQEIQPETDSLKNNHSVQNAKFSTYAITSMQYRLLNYVGSERLIYVPKYLRTKFRKISKLISALEQQNLNQPDRKTIGQKIAYDFAISESDALKLYETYTMYNSEKLVSVDFETVDDELGLIDESQNPLKNASDKELASEVSEVLDSLTSIQSQILRLRFGIDINNKSGYTVEEVGSIYDMCKERIRRIEAKALRRLKHPSRSDKIRGLYR